MSFVDSMSQAGWHSYKNTCLHHNGLELTSRPFRKPTNNSGKLFRKEHFSLTFHASWPALMHSSRSCTVPCCTWAMGCLLAGQYDVTTCKVTSQSIAWFALVYSTGYSTLCKVDILNGYLILDVNITQAILQFLHINIMNWLS